MNSKIPLISQSHVMKEEFSMWEVKRLEMSRISIIAIRCM